MIRNDFELVHKMEFVMVSKHEGLTLTDNLKTMTILSVPDAFLVYMGCESTSEYISSIVTCAFDINHEDIIAKLTQSSYIGIQGKVIFRHIKTMRTATVLFYGDCTILNDTIILISKIRNILWQDDDELVLVLGTICARISLNTIQSKTINRNDVKYIAIPSHTIQLSDSAKAQLEFLKCEFSVNVSYKADNNSTGTHVQRSILFPASLLLSDLPNLSSEKYWAYADFMNKKQPFFLEASSDWLMMLGVKCIKGDVQSNLEKQMSASEVSRTMSLIVPKLYILEQGGIYSDYIEFMTEHGRKSFKCTWYKTRSIIIGTVSVPDTL